MALKQAYIICLLFFVLLCFIMPPRGELDIGYWIGWTDNIKERGLAQAYTVEALNYNPGFLYVLTLYGQLMDTPQDVTANINHLKIFVLLFDFAPIMLLMGWLNKNKRDFFNAFFVLFNIAYLYNTMYWGQVDAIHTALVFFSVYLAIEQKLALSMVLFLLAINTKTQSVFFLPILGLLWLPILRHNSRQLAKGLLLLVIVQLAILLPFLMAGTASDVLNNFTGAVDFNHALSMHADNIWYLIVWDSADLPFLTSDLNQWHGLTLKTWGLILFFVFATIVMLPLIIKTGVKVLQKAHFSLADCEYVLLTAALVTLVFFYFPTQMHERYSHPAMLFMGGYFILSGRWFMFLLLSFAYLMNIEAVDRSWKLADYGALVFDARLLAIVFGIVIITGIYRLYKDYGLHADWKYLKSTFAKKAIA